MIEEPQVAMAASPREWAARLHRHLADHGGGRVRATILHPREAVGETYDVLVVDDTTSYLSHRLIGELQHQGRAVLGVYDPEDPRGKGELLEIGADVVLAQTATTEEFIQAITALTTERRTQPPAPSAGGPVAGGPEPVEPARGRLTAVGGPAGGPGATEIAIALAAAVGRRGHACVLLDADEVAPSVAQRLGLPTYPNLRTAVDAVEHLAGTLAETLALVAGGPFWALPGLARAADWAQVRPTETVEVARQLARPGVQVLANVGHRLEDLLAGGSPSRYATTRALLAAADVLVGVGMATPVGVARLVEWVADVRALAPLTPVHLIINRAPAGGFKRAEVEAELRRNLTPASLHFAAADPRVDAASWAAELVAAGPFRRGVEALADAAVPAAVAPLAGARPWARIRRRAMIS